MTNTTVISAHLADVLELSTRPLKSDVATKLLERAGVWQTPEHPATVAVFVAVAGEIDDRLETGRSLHVGGWAADIVRLTLPREVARLGCYIEDFDLGGRRVDGPLGRAMRETVERHLDQLVRRMVSSLVEEDGVLT
ncbi:MAG: hypothetical protein ACLGIB_01770 [Actinomycetota bacterium]